MKNNELYQKSEAVIIKKLENALKGDASLVRDNKVLTDEEKMMRMVIIEKYIKYIRDYDKNMEMIADYKDFMNRMVNDGR